MTLLPHALPQHSVNGKGIWCLVINWNITTVGGGVAVVTFCKFWILLVSLFCNGSFSWMVNVLSIFLAFLGWALSHECLLILPYESYPSVFQCTLINVCKLYFMFCLSNTIVPKTGFSMLVQGRNFSIFLWAIKLSLRRGNCSEESVLSR